MRGPHATAWLYVQLIQGHRREGVPACSALISGPMLNRWTLVCITGPEIPGLPSEESSPAASDADQGGPAQRQPGQADPGGRSWVENALGPSTGTG
eukprot:4824554-Alexandrium_andersonii.AAC.1